LLGRGCRSGLADHARNEHLRFGTNELRYFDAEYLGRTHLLVEKLNDAYEFVRQPIGDEHHSNSTSSEIAGDKLPEVFRVKIWTEVFEELFRVSC